MAGCIHWTTAGLVVVALLPPAVSSPAAFQSADSRPAESDLDSLLRRFRSEFVDIEPGKGPFPSQFTMGRASGGDPSERPVRQVRFDEGWSVARYEVTQELWQAVMGENPSRWKGPRNSVENVSHDDAMAFCRRITRLLRERELIDYRQVIRLPSEAEWEYTARAGTTSIYSFGDDAADLDRYAWFHGNAAGNDPEVGEKEPNAWGLYDVHGYLWEWCLDHGHADYRGAPTDGSAWVEGGDPELRVMRGGSWKDDAPSCTSTARSGDLRRGAGSLPFRGGAPGDLRDDAVGLRCVLATER